MATDRCEPERDFVRACPPVTITYADDGTSIEVCDIPKNGVISHIAVSVTTAFNDTGTDYLDIGDGSSATRYKSNADVSSTGLTNYDGGGYKYAAADTIDVQYDGQTGDSSTGSLTVTVYYTIDDNSLEQQEPVT